MIIPDLPDTPDVTSDLNVRLAAMDEPKPWWTSRGVIGSVVTVASSLAALAGWSIDQGSTTELALGLVSLAGGAMAWWGRARAVRPISKRAVLPGLTLRD
jgi:hypothetical protein